MNSSLQFKNPVEETTSCSRKSIIPLPVTRWDGRFSRLLYI